MKHFLTASIFILFSPIIQYAQNDNLSRHIDPFIGTGLHGHTFPGPCVPFGMVQLSPDTGTEGWDWCSGYHESDSSIMGFSHTHLSGTGCGELGDILFMPYTGDWKTEPGSKENPEEGYRSRFSHTEEKAEAGYYSVNLKSYNIKAELTAAGGSGFHKYTFPQSEMSNIIIDLAHGIDDSTDESWIEIIGNDQVRGFRKSSGWWAPDQYIYFHAQFNKPVDEYALVVDGKIITGETRAESRNVKALLRFKTMKDEIVYTKVGISAVSAENALANLKAEIPDWDFDKTRIVAAKAWDDQLSKIIVQGGTEEQKRTFYTAMYHSLLVPYLYMDVNGQYRGMDKKIYKAEGFTRYTLFSLWDTFRAAHPLYSIIAPEKNNDFIKTMLAMYDEAGRLPMWEMHTIETWGMSGYHSIPVIADAYLKGYGDFDIEKAFIAMKRSAEDEMLDDYKQYGYIPFDSDFNTVSTTLEYAYDDWCIAQVAKKLGRFDEYEKYIKRSRYYKNLFDSSAGFMRGKDSNGAWRKNFDPLYITPIDKGDFAEGNSWQYTFFVPQDVNGLIKLYGGPEKFAAKLDTLFMLESEGSEESLDVSGLIGQYAHGNEPGHHTAYLYNYAGEAFKTQRRVHEIMTEMYKDTRGGLPGNEDCGQMSAWYIFSALGFYPVNPADGVYVTGTPLFEKAEINLSGGKKFTVKANNISDKNFYIQSAKLNGKPYNLSYITHEDILNGGVLEFEMGSAPSKWGCAEGERPVSEIH